MSRAAVFLVGLVATTLASVEPGDAPAGRAELRAIDGRITEIERTLRDDESAMEAKRHEALDLFVDDAARFIADYRPYRGPVPQTYQEFAPWWLPTLKERLGYDPLEPNDAWQRRWQDARRAEHAIYRDYEALRVALRRLERLRDRLRAQLGLPTEATP